jgi:hypothetical protein
MSSIGSCGTLYDDIAGGSSGGGGAGGGGGAEAFFASSGIFSILLIRTLIPDP